jgi:hypothetical protein
LYVVCHHWGRSHEIFVIRRRRLRRRRLVGVVIDEAFPRLEQRSFEALFIFRQL